VFAEAQRCQIIYHSPVVRLSTGCLAVLDGSGVRHLERPTLCVIVVVYLYDAAYLMLFYVHFMSFYVILCPFYVIILCIYVMILCIYVRSGFPVVKCLSRLLSAFPGC